MANTLCVGWSLIGAPLHILSRIANFYADEYSWALRYISQALPAVRATGERERDQRAFFGTTVTSSDGRDVKPIAHLAERCLIILHVLLQNRR
jgi:hypothetical protein